MTPAAHPKIEGLFGVPRALIGMVHVGALPGTPANSESVGDIARRAASEARLYQEAGFHGVAIENMHDLPYLRGQVGPEITAAMAVVGAAVKAAIDLPLGVQVLAGANVEAMAVAHAVGADFVRVEGFVFAHVADEGVHQSDAGQLLRYRRAIGADGVLVFADIKKKHSSHALTDDLDLAETARAAAFFGADGVIVTGAATGQPADADDLAEVVAGVAGDSRPALLVGSGVDAENVGSYYSADALIVGTSVKDRGDWRATVSKRRAAALVAAFDAA